jgi:hypothetical protein
MASAVRISLQWQGVRIALLHSRNADDLEDPVRVWQRRRTSEWRDSAWWVMMGAAFPLTLHLSLEASHIAELWTPLLMVLYATTGLLLAQWHASTYRYPAELRLAVSDRVLAAQHRLGTMIAFTQQFVLFVLLPLAVLAVIKIWFAGVNPTPDHMLFVGSAAIDVLVVALQAYSAGYLIALLFARTPMQWQISTLLGFLALVHIVPRLFTLQLYNLRFMWWPQAFEADIDRSRFSTWCVSLAVTLVVFAATRYFGKVEHWVYSSE